MKETLQDPFVILYIKMGGCKYNIYIGRPIQVNTRSKLYFLHVIDLILNIIFVLFKKQYTYINHKKTSHWHRYMLKNDVISFLNSRNIMLNYKV